LPKLKLFLLGAPNVELDGQPADISRRKAIALMAYLAVEGQPHTRDELATLFWPDYESSQSYAYLRRALWEINNALGKGWLETDRDQVEIGGAGELWLDVAAFETALAGGRAEQGPAGELERLAAAVSLYKGDFMAGFSLADAPQFDMWQRFTSERLRRQYAQALERLVAGLEGQGELEPAIEYAGHWLALDPLHEPAHRALMRLYAAAGQRAAAIRQYEAAAAILDDELGLAPEAETTALHDQIAQGQWPARETSEPAARPARRRKIVRLPHQPTPFVGRREEMEAIVNLIAEPSCHLLSLVGPGGSGKSRLAIRVAEQLVEQKQPAVADGAYFVGLAPLVSSDSIGPAIGKSLGGDFYQDGQEPRRQMIDYLRHKHLLLILDNFEHLLDDEAFSLLGDLMAELGELKLLVTSRVRLNIRGEQLFPVAGMKAPAQRKVLGRSNGESALDPAEAQTYSALRLFVQSARHVRPDFQLTAQNLPAVVSICQTVQGMPLAIELAAGWIELLSPAEIAAEIARGLDFLATELQDVPDRQRSIRAVFESSWKLLNTREREIMARLSVFRGGFDRRAAEWVSGATLRNLLSLASKSWLQQEGGGRFQIHELLRQYASEKLAGEKLAAGPAEWEQANDRHATYYAELLAEAGREMGGPDQLAAIKQLAAEFDNISVAWRWHVEQGRFRLLIQEMLPALFRFSVIRSTGEELLSLVRLASAALRPDKDGPPEDEASAILLTYEVRARLLITYWDSYEDLLLQAWSYVQEQGIDRYADWLVWLADAYAWQVDRDEGGRLLARLADEAQRAGDAWGEALAKLSLADIISMDGHYVQALRAARQAQQIFQALGDIGMRAFALRRVGGTLWKMGDYDQAEQVLLAGRELFRATADQGGEAEIIQELHEMNLMAGRFERAFDYFAERRAIAWALDQRQMVHESLHWESIQAARFGDPEHARALRVEGLALARALGDPLRVAWGLWEMGELLRLEGDLVGARQKYSDALEHFKQTEHLEGIAFYNRGLGDIALMEGDFETARLRYELYLELARAVSHLWSVAYALSGLGRAEVALGELAHARQHFRESFEQAFIISRDLCMVPLYGLASCLAADGEPAQALELAAFVASYHLSWHETRRLATELIAATRGRLPEAEVNSVIERGRQRDLDSVIIEYELEAKGAADE
jgi:DNA-binding SARP family transcriptional activator/predicted ATPase/tetratricopeptide (TPR) repeat protein